MIKIKFIFIVLLTLLIPIISQNRCYTNLECIETGCCHEEKCDESSKCKRINKISYALVGTAGFIFIGLTFLVFFFKIKKTRKSILELKKIDDKFYAKRRNSNVEMLRRIRKSVANL